MRDLLFLIIFLPMPFICILRPWLGLLIWAWFAYSFPTANLWGIGSTLPGNMIITSCTLIGWAIASQERKLPPLDATNLLFIALALITVASTVFSLAPERSMRKVPEYASMFIYLMLLSMFLCNKVRIHAFVWITAFSIAHYAVKCSIFFVGTGGSYRAEGPVGTQIWDNNHLAVACLLVIPLLNYLRLHSRPRWVRVTVLGTTALTALAVVGTFSRGGFIGLIAMLGYLWWKKISHLLVMAVGISAVVATASESWLSRMQTIETAHEEDDSFLSRLESWKVYWSAAVDRPLTGVGPKALEDPKVSFNYRSSMLDTGEAIAAHSIYFQLVGEEGFVALAIYIAMLYTCLGQRSLDCTPRPRRPRLGLGP